jgi:hypothetical protein
VSRQPPQVPRHAFSDRSAGAAARRSGCWAGREFVLGIAQSGDFSDYRGLKVPWQGVPPLTLHIVVLKTNPTASVPSEAPGEGRTPCLDEIPYVGRASR